MTEETRRQLRAEDLEDFLVMKPYARTVLAIIFALRFGDHSPDTAYKSADNFIDQLERDLGGWKP